MRLGTTRFVKIWMKMEDYNHWVFKAYNRIALIADVLYDVLYATGIDECDEKFLIHYGD